MRQNNSVFMPGLTSRGPVYNSLGLLPTLSPMVKFGVIGALLYFSAVKKKLPLPVAAVGAFAVWQFFPTDASASSTAATPSPVIANPIPDVSSSLDFSNVQPPAMVTTS